MFKHVPPRQPRREPCEGSLRYVDLTVRVDLNSQWLAGELRIDGRAVSEFHGWRQLLTVLDQALDTITTLESEAP
jgi:hypothetical protein